MRAASVILGSLLGAAAFIAFFHLFGLPIVAFAALIRA